MVPRSARKVTLTNVGPNGAGPRQPTTGQDAANDEDDTDEDRCLPGNSDPGDLILAVGVGDSTSDTCKIKTNPE